METSTTSGITNQTDHKPGLRAAILDGAAKSLNSVGISGGVEARIQHFNNRLATEEITSELIAHYSHALEGVDCLDPKIKGELQDFIQKCSDSLRPPYTPASKELVPSYLNAIKILELYRDPVIFGELFVHRQALEDPSELISKFESVLVPARAFHQKSEPSENGIQIAIQKYIEKINYLHNAQLVGQAYEAICTGQLEPYTKKLLETNSEFRNFTRKWLNEQSEKAFNRRGIDVSRAGLPADVKTSVAKAIVDSNGIVGQINDHYIPISLINIFNSLEYTPGSDHKTYRNLHAIFTCFSEVKELHKKDLDVANGPAIR